MAENLPSVYDCGMNDTLAKYMSLYKDRIAKPQRLSKSRGKGGAIRQSMGDLVESLVTEIWRTETGGDVRKTTFPAYNTRGDKIKFQVDNHCYLKDGSLRLLVESKTYLDRTFLERADNDFAMLQGALCDPNVRTAIVSIENAIAKDAFDFYMGRRNIDKVFFLTEGKRSSKTPLWGKNQYKPLNEHLLQELVNYVREVSAS